MASHFPGVPSHHGMNEGRASRTSQERPEGSANWFLSRKEIEECSPSRKNGIDLKKESYLRKSYCTFLQDLGMRLKVPQVTIATSIIFCHRFFLRQSHAKNDRRTIATVCMFLAGKVEESPRPLKDVIIVSYEIIYKKDPAAVHRIKQKDVYEQQKELILLAERLVLATLDFDLNLLHPYKPLVEAIKKFKVAQNTLAQVAWNFVNDGLRTSLCLQFKPHHIAAGAIFLAAKFLKVKLPSDGDKVWWQEFDVTPRQLEEVSNQMLELYEQNRVAPSQASEAEESAAVGVSRQPPSKAPASNEEHAVNKTKSLGGDTTLKSASAPDHYDGPSKYSQNLNSDYGSGKIKDASDQKGDGEVVNQHNDSEQLFHQENSGEATKRFESGSERSEDGKRNNDKRVINEAINKIDKDKVRAILEKRKKAREVPRKVDVMGEEDLIERELEEGIELSTKNERRKSLEGYGNGHKAIINGLSLSDEEFDDAGHGYGLPKSSSRKRKAGGPLEKE